MRLNKRIELKHGIHRGKNVVYLLFPYDKQLIDVVRKMGNARWAEGEGAWYIESDRFDLGELFRALKGLAYIDYAAIRGRKDSVAVSGREKKAAGTVSAALVKKMEAPLGVYYRAYTDQFRNWLEHKRYSASSVKTYVEGVRIFLKYIQPRRYEEVTPDDMVGFVHEWIVPQGLSFSYQNQVVSATKLFFREVVRSKLDVERFERPRREHKLPNVLSKEEVKRIINAPQNMKHRAMLSLIYACGLRRSELIALKPGDIDSKRGLLLIRNAKGRKDRVVPISERIIDMLRQYFVMYKPKVWLFEGQVKGGQYSAESLSNVLKRSCEIAKVNRPVTLHWLRHSYATHLLESGTDIRYIQELLGHRSSKTTEIYTHVSTKSIQQIKSPFDDL